VAAQCVSGPTPGFIQCRRERSRQRVRCGKQMAVLRTIEKNDADRVLNVFECAGCRLSYTVAEDEEEERRDP